MTMECIHNHTDQKMDGGKKLVPPNYQKSLKKLIEPSGDTNLLYEVKKNDQIKHKK